MLHTFCACPPFGTKLCVLPLMLWLLLHAPDALWGVGCVLHPFSGQVLCVQMLLGSCGCVQMCAVPCLWLFVGESSCVMCCAA